MPELIRHPEGGGLGTWIPVFTGMTDDYISSLFTPG